MASVECAKAARRPTSGIVPDFLRFATVPEVWLRASWGVATPRAIVGLALRWRAGMAHVEGALNHMEHTLETSGNTARILP